MESEEEEETRLSVWGCSYRYARFTYRYPWVIILICLAFVIAMTCWWIIVYGIEITAEIDNYRYSGQPSVIPYDAFVQASKDTYYSTYDRMSSTIEMDQQSSQTGLGLFVYEREGQNILEPKVLKDIWDMEDEIWNDPRFPDYCFKPGNYSSDANVDPITGCAYFQSVIYYFKQFLQAFQFPVTSEILSDEERARPIIRTFLELFPEIPINFLSRDCNSTHQYSTIMRTLISFGFPLKGYLNKEDRSDEQNEKLRDVGIDLVKPSEEILNNAPNGLRSYDYLPGVIDYKISQLILSEVLWLIGSFGCVIVFAFIKIGSITLALSGVVGVFFNIPSAIAVCYCFVGIKVFDAMNVLGLFLICGVGADSIFLLYDLLRQTKKVKGATPELRLAYAWQHGLSSLAVSCLTSAVCFLSMCTSGAKVLIYFGLFCFFELIFDFIYTITWYFAFLAIYLRFLEKKQCCKKSDHKEVKHEEINIEEYPDKGILDCFHKKPTFNIQASGLDLNSYSKAEKFVHNYVIPVIYFYRLPIVIITIVVAIVMGVMTFRFTPKVEMTFLDSSHPLQHGYTILLNSFHTSTDDFSMLYVCGIKPELHPTVGDSLEYGNFGDPIYFDMNFRNSTVQKFLYDACAFMASRDEIIEPSGSTVCPINYLKEVVEARNLTFPDYVDNLNDDEYNEIMLAFQDALNSLGASEPDTDPGTSSKDTIGFGEDGNLLYIAVKSDIILPESMESSLLHQIYNKTRVIQNELQELAPDSLKQCYVTSGCFVQMETQDQITSQVVLNVALSTVFAIVVIFIMTLSITYTILFAISIVSVIFIVFGVLYLVGWQVGMNEAVMFTIASGFCTDYIVHTMNAMAHDDKNSRFGKIQRSLTTYFSPVFSALITTILSAVFLYPAEILIFPPFATFLIMSGVFGTYSGFIFLPAMVGIVAPKRGDRLTKLCHKKKKEKELKSITEETEGSNKPQKEEELEDSEKSGESGFENNSSSTSSSSS
ncbi:dispatched-like protein [Histomonas meleagridis]|uniref:dispatched-like protein n=1 Tax=Histomonas meleagridis TaxID=135588 RepID=UPI00355A4774|nr:dispatched-like protein [Histomonas meleagridis]KAH0806336.1 dispatched-like protein [Histomonas meleagridis]